jgi:hypothetical protein
MKILRIAILFILFSPFFQGCEEFLTTNNPLTDSEVIEGLKTALLVGTDSSVTETSRANGYYKDEVIKILLPPEADIIYENKDNVFFAAIGLDKKLEDAIMAINMAAEDAAKEAGPIFKTAITDMSISDGWEILNGTNPAGSKKSDEFDSTAATNYLRSTTYTQLSDAFSPKINSSLDKKLVGTYSPNDMWNTLTTSYNSVADNSFGLFDPIVNTDLGVYVTEKALDGLFYKVSLQEKEIRKDPLKWAATAVGNILEKVFGASEK